MVAGVLLTGGRSRRLGVDKARVLLDGEALAMRTARVLGAVCAPCIEVGTGASALRCVRETPAGEGPLAAFVCGVRALEAIFDCPVRDGVVLLACDMPLVTVELLRWIVDRAAPTVVPVARGRAQYGCAKYGGSVLDAMRGASDAGTRSFKWLHGGASHDAVDWVDESVWSSVAAELAFRDVDTPDDAREAGVTIEPT